MSGELTVGDGVRISSATTRAALAAAFGGERSRLTDCALLGECVELTFVFSGERLKELVLRLPGSGDATELHLRHTNWLARHFGPPGSFHARGALWALPWGFVYVLGGAARVVYPGTHSRLARPGADVPESDVVPFRCVQCGSVARLPYSTLVLRAGKERGAVPCETCGAVSWVQVGTTTEFYAWTARAEVCEVGNHTAESVTRFTLVPRVALATNPEALQVSALYVKACPAHVAELRRDGVLGFVLPEGE